MRRLLPCVVGLLIGGFFTTGEAGAETPPSAKESGIDWCYTISVSDEGFNRQFTVSLMNDGSLAFDQFLDEENRQEQVIHLTAGQSQHVRQLLDTSFAAARKSVESSSERGGPPYSVEMMMGIEMVKDGSKDEHLYVFEKIGEPTVNLLLNPPQPLIATILSELQKLIKEPYPFFLEPLPDDDRVPDSPGKKD